MQQTTSHPKWGSSVQKKKLVVEIDTNHGWGPATKDEVADNNEDVVDHEERRVEIIDVSDNEGEEQFPPPPKDRRWYMNLLTTETWELEVWL